SDRHNVSNKALLLFDNAQSHPVNLNDLSDHVRVENIPKNTTALLQPMDDVWDFLKKFNIMDTMENRAEPWDEAKTSAINSVWENIWPECIHEFAEVIDDDVIELLHFHGENLSNEDLMLLEQERAAGEEKGIEAPSTPLQLTTKEMAKGFTLIQECLQIFAGNDPNCEHNLKVARAVHNGLSCC
ncbi:Tigger transposable element-derived protein 1-like 103, partial [Homarus americanus]